MPHQHSVTYIARTNPRYMSRARLFGIRRADRRTHMLLSGKTGTGKTTLMKGLIRQDLERGEGLAVFDPHGDLAAEVAALVPASQQDDLVYFDLPAGEIPLTFNPLADVPKRFHALAVSGLVEVFKKLWSDDWGPRLEHLLRNVLWTLVAQGKASLLDVPPLLANRDYRKKLLANVDNQAVLDFWRGEFEEYSPKFKAVIVAPLQNKVGAFLTDPLVRRLLSGRRALSMRAVIDSRKILLVNVAKGAIGEGPAALVGSLFVSALSLAGLSRCDVPEDDRPDFYCYLDEFQTFATLSLSTMLSELRKYRLCMVLAHQYVAQIERPIRDAVLGNVGTSVVFRIGAGDAGLLAAELGNGVEEEELTVLANYHCFVKLMVDGEVLPAFSAVTVSSLQAALKEQVSRLRCLR